MLKKHKVEKNKSFWENMNPAELDSFSNEIFDYYREKGFPYYSTDRSYREKEFNKLMKYDHTNLIKDGVINQTMHGLGLAWSYFPHSFAVKCNNKLSPYDAFMNDEIFMKVIRKRLKIGTYISDAGILKMLKMYTGVQGVSNFRPTAAAAIYDKYAPNGIVWDMSGGWGGRMLGAMRSSVQTYITTEPATLTFNGLVELGNDFSEVSNTKVSPYPLGSEEFLPIAGALDLCFTSPPYFDLEKYSDEDTQSYVKFNNKNSWIDKFLRVTFENCHWGLKPNGHMIINIADPKRGNDISLEKATIDTAIEVGFTHVETLKLALSNPNMRNKSDKFKFEPVFVFQKL